MRCISNCSLLFIASAFLAGCAFSSTTPTNLGANHIIRSTIDEERRLLLGGEHLAYLPIPKFNLCLIGRQMRDETISLTRGMLSECRRAHDEKNTPDGVFGYYAEQLQKNPELFSRFFTDKQTNANFLIIMTPTGSTALIRLTTEEAKNPAIAAAFALVPADS